MNEFHERLARLVGQNLARKWIETMVRNQRQRPGKDQPVRTPQHGGRNTLRTGCSGRVRRADNSRAIACHPKRSFRR